MSRKHGRSRTPAPAPFEVTTADPLTIDARFVASRELLARARGRVTPADVARYVPNDPGCFEYLAAFEAILHRGEAALSREFAVTETIALTRWGDAPTEVDPTRFRWFRVLTCATEVLLDDSEWPHYGLAALLVDSFALEEAGVDAEPTDLLSAVAREVAAHPLRYFRPDEHAFCVLAELLLAGVDHLDHAGIEALCAALEVRYRRWWEFRGAYWADPPHPEKSLWRLTGYSQLHSVWLDLVATRFPVEPPVAAAMKQRLLTDGARWIHGRRVLS
jgi:hypothetical protein